MTAHCRLGMLRRTLTLAVSAVLLPAVQAKPVPVRAAETAVVSQQITSERQTLQFLTRALPGESQTATDIALGDVNNDGVQDIVRTSLFGPVQVLLGKGDGFFNNPINTYARNYNGQSISLADIDGDSKLDIVNTGSYSAEILIGRGDGSFDLNDMVFDEYLQTSDFIVSDLNKDKLLDIISPQSKSIFINTKNNTFGSPVHFLQDHIVNEAIVSDINNDGHAEIIATDHQESQLIIYSHSERKTRRSGDENTNWSRLKIRTITDINNDGIPDIIATGTIDHISAVSSLNISFGIGNWLFQKPIAILKNLKTTSEVKIGDLNGDGLLDIIMTNQSDNFNVSVAFGINGNEFANPIGISAERSEIYDIELGDMNNDGAIDIVITKSDQSYLLLNLQHNSFDTPRNMGKSNIYSEFIDLNNDNMLDIFTGDRVIKNIGYGQFTEINHSINLDQEFPQQFDWGDFNKDGFVDLVTGSTTNKPGQIILGIGNSQFGTPKDLPGDIPSVSDMIVGDINGDDILDIVVSTEENPSQILLLSGKGDGTFNAPIPMSNKPCFMPDIHLSNLNNDNIQDIVVGCTNYDNFILLGSNFNRYDTDITFKNPFKMEEPRAVDDFAYVATTETADINSDNINDIVILYEDAGDSIILIFTGSDDIMFSNYRMISQNTTINDLNLIDFNNDGSIDIVVKTREGIKIFYGAGDGSFEEPLILSGGDLLRATFDMGDTDGDGVLDMLLADDTFLQLQRGLPSKHFTQTNPASAITLDVRTVALQPETTPYLSELNSALFHMIQLVNDLPYRFFGPADPSGVPEAQADAGAMSDQPAEAAEVEAILFGLDASLRSLRNTPSKLFRQSGPAQSAQPSVTTTARPVPGSHSAIQPWPRVRVLRPDGIHEAPDSQSPFILDTAVITIPYQLSDPEGDRVRAVQGFYSLDGGGTWRVAAVSGSQAMGLAADPAGSNHVFRWDTAASGITGQYDNVLFRIVALPYTHISPGQAPTPPMLRSPSATSSRFRLRGTQARVVNTQGEAVFEARVYRLPDKQINDAQLTPAPVNGNPQWYTDWQGYLKGHDPLTITDRLVALAPISATTTYTLYHTSARPTPSGLAMYTIKSPGVQTLAISPKSPLVLFNLGLSVEWDARSDTGFRTQLDKQIKRASELLFRWSGGQAALGDITIFNNSQNWNTAHIRLYATNRMRPSAAQGGIVEDRHPDPSNPELVYEPGQLRMGAVWNRYGEASAELGEEWARTLAHELGHYALFLNDNYLVKRDGRLITSGECPGPMTDPYDDSEGSFRPPADWLPACANTLSQLENNRDDWTTIKTFYTANNFALNEPSAFKPQDNPGLLPLAVTQVRFDADFDASDNLPLAGALVLLADSAGKPLRLGSRARGMLYQDSLMVDLGSPVEERLVARGARRGDTVCVYAIDPVKSRQRHGCVTITSNNQQLRLPDTASWQPDVRLSPVTTATLQLEVSAEGFAVGETLKAQLYTTEKNVLPEITLGRVGDTEVYSATLDTIEGTALEGMLRIWSTGMTRREVVVDLRVDGNPGAMWSRGVGRTSPGAMWSRGAPLLSVDGQAILYTSQIKLDPGTMYLLQATDGAPAPPAWATPVSRAYRLSATPDALLAGSSLNINYLSQDVPFGQEQGVRLFAWDAGTRQWRLLDTYLDQERNEASAVVSEEGLYMLMTATEVLRGGQGWNLNAFYPGTTQPLAQATATISGGYSLIAGFEAGQSDPWRIYDPALPAAWAPLVNDLSLLRTGERYWLHATAPISWFVRGPDKQHAQQSSPTTAAPTAARSLPPSLPAGAPGGQTGQRLLLGSLPPAVFYGLAPAEGLGVEALVDGQLCDSTTTSLQTVDGVQRAVFVIKVRALGDGNTNCGVRDRSVRLAFSDGTQRDAVWDNTRAQNVDTAVVTP